MRRSVKWKNWAVVCGMVATAALAFGCDRSSGGNGASPPADSGPAIVRVTPESGDLSGGDTVVIVLEGFLDDLTVAVPIVYFGAVEAIDVTPLDASTVTVVTPLSPVAETVDVVVATTGILQEATMESAFTYGAPEPSACAAFSVGPFVGPVAGGQTITVGVADHGQNPTVLFGGNQAPSVTVLGPYFLEVITPPAASLGHVDVTVVPGTIGSCTIANAYTYE